MSPRSETSLPFDSNFEELNTATFLKNLLTHLGPRYLPGWFNLVSRISSSL